MAEFLGAAAAADELLRRFHTSLRLSGSPASADSANFELSNGNAAASPALPPPAPAPAPQAPQQTFIQAPQRTQIVVQHRANVDGVYGGMQQKLSSNTPRLVGLLERSMERLAAQESSLPTTAPQVTSAVAVTTAAMATPAAPSEPPTPPATNGGPLMMREGAAGGEASWQGSEGAALPAPDLRTPTLMRQPPTTPTPPSALVSRFGGISLETPRPGREPAVPTAVIEAKIVEAARDAARWLAVDDSQWHQAKKFIDDCLIKPNPAVLRRRGITEEQWLEGKLERIRQAVAADEGLATCRHINRAVLPMDGWTPLHAAAAVGNVAVAEALLESSAAVSAWVVDLQGRTPLALAAERGHADVCAFLRHRMEREASISIVGSGAPVDLAGRTPLGWSVRSRARNRTLEQQLYAVGDASICPLTPAAARGGSGGSGGDALVFGFAEAPGWRVEMEDAVCAHCPLPGEGAGSGLFGVFDGHGGDFSSHFAAERLLESLLATEAWRTGGRSPEEVGAALTAAFLSVDAALAAVPRMAVEEQQGEEDGSSGGCMGAESKSGAGNSDSGGDASAAAVGAAVSKGGCNVIRRYKARDSSGSTAVVAVVTPEHVIVANAGDSRALVLTPAAATAAAAGGFVSFARGATSAASVSVHELSRDHTALEKDERERVEAAGGAVEERRFTTDGGSESTVLRIRYHPEVRGQSVIPSRSLGDFYYKKHAGLPPDKQVVTAAPEVMSHHRNAAVTAEYLLLACDGVWDVLTCQEAGDFFCDRAAARPATGEGLAAACDDLVQEALARHSTDNITVMAVRLPPLGQAVGRVGSGAAGGGGGRVLFASSASGSPTP